MLFLGAVGLRGWVGELAFMHDFYCPRGCNLFGQLQDVEAESVEDASILQQTSKHLRP